MRAHRILSFSVLAILAILASAISLRADSDDPPGRAARLSFLSGNVSFEPSGETEWNDATLNYPLTAGDRLYADRNGKAEFEIGNVAVRLSGGTDASITNLTDQLFQLGLAEGVLRLRAYSLLQGNTIEIDTPNAALNVLSAGNYRIETYPDENTTFVTVTSGELEIDGADFSQTLHAGEAAKVSGTGMVPVRVAPSGVDSFDDWCRDRDNRFQSSKSVSYVGTYTPGYYDLDQYGTWETVSEYGPVWYPVAIPAGWAPYRFGRWAWVEPWGWTWVGVEPWAFCPFHYGRWVMIGPRWAWVPGPVVTTFPVYSPALVAFVGGPGFAIGIGGPPVAWFPLGPREPFFPWYHHSDHYLERVNVTNVRNVVNIREVINVRNTEEIHYVNRQVATTAVPAEAFRRGEMVDRAAVKVDAATASRARVVPHPEVTPERTTIAAGAPPAHPPIESARPAMPYRAPSAGVRVPQERPRVNVPQPRNPGAAANSGGAFGTTAGTNASPPVQRPAPPRRAEENVPSQPLPNTPANVPPPMQRPTPPPHPAENVPPLVTHSAPPANVPPFEARRPAMEEHPGRPLEPAQVDNVRRGEPAGPMHDREMPPHASPPPQRAPAPSGGRPPGDANRRDQR